MNDKNIFIGVCEDNSLHINLVKGYIDDFFNEFHNYEVLEFVSGEDLLSNYPNNIDLLFLDIQMNGLNGMDVARRIREFDNNVEIIFTTSVLDYVCEGYEVNAYRYMLKPIEYNIFKNIYYKTKKDTTPKQCPSSSNILLEIIDFNHRYVQK